MTSAFRPRYQSVMNGPDPFDHDRAPSASERRWTLFERTHVPYRILLLAKMIDRVSSQQVREQAGMSLAEWRVISQVELMGTCSASEIANAAFVDRAEVSRAVAALEGRGLIQREPNPRNRKSSLISLTGEGRKIYVAIREERRPIYEEWLRDLSEQERAELDEGLRKVMRRVLLATPDAFPG
jgi:DNA-binding MarR family transcriptional regulator